MNAELKAWNTPGGISIDHEPIDRTRSVLSFAQ